MEPVRKRKLADEELAVDNTPVKKSKVESNTPVADFLIFGSGDQGNQLPLELTKTVKFRRKPAVVKQFENCKIRQICAAGYHTAVLIDKDFTTELYTWGCNDDGVLGRPINQEDKDTEESTPTKVQIESLSQLCVGSYHMYGLTADGKLYGWGTYKEENGFLGFLNDDDTPIKQFSPIRISFFDDNLKKGVKLVTIASSFNATIALTSTGKVYEWGAISQRVKRRTERTKVRADERKSQLEPQQTRLTGIKSIFAGGEVQFAIAKNGDVWGWGINGFGQIGNGDTQSHEGPIKLKGFPENIIEIACGQSHTLLLTEGGQVFSFGRNAYGQLGHGEDEPAPIKGAERKLVSKPKLIEFFENLPDGEKAIKIAAGDQHSAVVTSKGSLYTFGFGEQYRLGNCTDPGDEEEEVLTPYKVKSAQIDTRNVISVTCGTDHTAIIASKREQQ